MNSCWQEEWRARSTMEDSACREHAFCRVRARCFVRLCSNAVVAGGMKKECTRKNLTLDRRTVGINGFFRHDSNRGQGMVGKAISQNTSRRTKIVGMQTISTGAVPFFRGCFSPFIGTTERTPVSLMVSWGGQREDRIM